MENDTGSCYRDDLFKDATNTEGDYRRALKEGEFRSGHEEGETAGEHKDQDAQ